MESIVNQKLRERFQKFPINRGDAINLIALIQMEKAEQKTIRAFVIAECDFNWVYLPTFEHWRCILSAADPFVIADMNRYMVIRCRSTMRHEVVALIEVMVRAGVAEDATLMAFSDSPSFAETVTPILLEAVMELKPKPE